MKPIHFQPKTDAADRNRAATEAHQANSRSGHGVAAVVRSAPPAEQSAAPKHERKIQLEDYVARIRAQANAGQPPSATEVTFSTSIDDPNENAQTASVAATDPVSAASSGPDVILPAQVADKSESQVVYRTDTGHTTMGSDQSMPTGQIVAPHVPAERFPEEGYQFEQQRQVDASYQQQLVDEISVAIASTLTDAPDQTLQQKLPATTAAAEDPPTQQQTDLPVNVAAWDVDDFHWSALSNQMIATASDAMQQLYDNVLNVSLDPQNRPSNRLAVAGAGRGEGTSTIAASIARWAAACGKSVLLIDADLANPSLTTQVGLRHGLSWLEAASRSDDPAEVVIRSKQNNLCVMPLAPIQTRANYPNGLYDTLGPFVGKIESHFDWVIMDFGPGNQIFTELSRPELLIDSALLIGTEQNSGELQSLQRRLSAMGLERFVLANNSVSRQEAA